MNDRQSLMGCYFRSWRDTANGTVDNCTSMLDLPEEVDIAFVFPNGEETPLFWEKLGSELIPAMHAKRIKVVRTLFIDELINPDFAETSEGYDALCAHLIEQFLSVPGLDGLDVDLEKALNEAQRTKAQEVSLRLARHLKGNGQLFIYDTSELGDIPLIESLGAHLDYVLFQAYGQTPARVQGHFDRLFAGFLPPEKFMVGFSFYEERGTAWGDTAADIEQSTAGKYAGWNLTQGRKAGIFSYAVDRDGVKERDDHLQATDYSWTRRLKQLMS
ncbi:Endo-beta-N-acetylglucosaminidase F2 precursor [compost metagenome]